MKKRILIAAITSLGLVGMAQADDDNKHNLFKVEKTSGEVMKELKEKGTFTDRRGQVYQSWELKEIAEAVKKTASSAQQSQGDGAQGKHGWHKGQSKNLIKTATKRGKGKDKNREHASIAGNIGQLTGSGLGSTSASIDYDNTVAVQPVAGTGMLAGLSFNSAAFSGTTDLQAIANELNSEVAAKGGGSGTLNESGSMSTGANKMSQLMEGMDKYDETALKDPAKIAEAKSTMSANALSVGDSALANQIAGMTNQQFVDFISNPQAINLAAGTKNLNTTDQEATDAAVKQALGGTGGTASSSGSTGTTGGTGGSSSGSGGQAASATK